MHPILAMYFTTENSACLSDCESPIENTLWNPFVDFRILLKVKLFQSVGSLGLLLSNSSLADISFPVKISERAFHNLG
jgi:hypothetical protein